MVIPGLLESCHAAASSASCVPDIHSTMSSHVAASSLAGLDCHGMNASSGAGFSAGIYLLYTLI